MNREFFLNAVFLLVVNLLIKPFYVFGIERTIQDTVGAHEYGLYATLFSFTFLFFIANDFGIHYFNNRAVAQTPAIAGRYLQNILVLKSLLTVFYIAIVLLAALLRGFESGVFYLIIFIALNHVFISFVAYTRSNISGLGLYRTDSLISTLDKVILIVICGVLLWGGVADGPFQIEWFVHAQNTAWLITAIIAFIILKRHIKSPLSLGFRWPFLLAVLKKSAPYAIAVFLMTAYTRLDIVLLEWIVPEGRTEAGVYAAAYRLLDAFNMVGVLFAGLLLPMFASLLRKQKSPNPEVQSLLQLSLHLIWAGTITLTVSCFFFRHPLMLWLYPNTASIYYGDVLAYIILTLVPFSGIYIYSTLLTANGNLKEMNYLFVLGIVINIVLNLLLIPPYKAVGAGISALGTQSLVLLGQMAIAKKKLQLPIEPYQLTKVILFILTFTILSWQLTFISEVKWLLKFSLSIISGLGLALLFRLIHVKALIELVKG